MGSNPVGGISQKQTKKAILLPYNSLAVLFYTLEYNIYLSLTVLVELLDEKGIVGYDEWESKIREKIESVKGLTKFEDLED